MLISNVYFIKKVSCASGSKQTKIFEVRNGTYQVLVHNNYKSGLYQKTSLLKRTEVNQNV